MGCARRLVCFRGPWKKAAVVKETMATGVGETTAFYYTARLVEPFSISLLHEPFMFGSSPSTARRVHLLPHVAI